MKKTYTAQKLQVNARRSLLTLILMAGSATLAIAQNITITGTIYDDGNGGAINGVPTSAAGTNPLYVYLLNNNSPAQVVDKTMVGPTGTYSLIAAANTSYNVALSSNNVSINTSGPNLGLPTDYVPTAEGTTGTGDGYPDYGVAINSGSNLVINYGINQRPIGNDYTISSPSYDAGNKIIIPAAAFSGSDAEDGDYTAGYYGHPVDLYQAAGGALYYGNTLITFSSANAATRIPNFDVSLLRFEFQSGIPHKFAYSTVDASGTPELVPNDINILFPLPIRLTSFTGLADGADNILQWQTATETANSRFDVERSEDGAHFTTIGIIGSKAEGGNSTQALSYQYQDYAANVAAHQPFFYRIKQIDLDGQSTYSRTIRIAGGNMAGAMQLATYPNPSTGHLSLDMATGSNIDEPLTVTVMSTSGTMMLTRSFNAKAGRISTALDLSAFPAGTYYVQLRSSSAPAQVQQIVLLPH